jgi:hypothetical protein
MFGSGVNSSGQSIPPDGVPLGSPENDPLGLNLEPYRSPVEVNDVPLNQLGNGSADLFPANDPAERFAPLLRDAGAEAVPAPEAMPDSESSQQEFAPPSNSSLAPIGYTERVGDGGYAPQPVKRRSISTQALRSR